mmetsp:Transcript_30756/g.65045  ORF Transcript_30756/g.65045 Transcript_30756/m.65045 type:complete len:226 (+) Transcript_30756:151-828(+)
MPPLPKSGVPRERQSSIDILRSKDNLYYFVNRWICYWIRNAWRWQRQHPPPRGEAPPPRRPPTTTGSPRGTPISPTTTSPRSRSISARTRCRRCCTVITRGRRPRRSSRGWDASRTGGGCAVGSTSGPRGRCTMFVVACVSWTTTTMTMAIAATRRQNRPNDWDAPAAPSSPPYCSIINPLGIPTRPCFPWRRSIPRNSCCGIRTRSPPDAITSLLPLRRRRPNH